MNTQSDTIILGLMRNLTIELNQYDYLYWVQNTSVVTDQVFDAKLQELRKLEEQYPQYKQVDSPTSRIGSVLTDGFKKVTHVTPMLSLENAFNVDDLLAFGKRVEKALGGGIRYFIEPKFDGLAVELVYVDGIFAQAATRGTGTVGDDVTANVKTIKTVPLSLSKKHDYAGTVIRIKGEVLFLKVDFDAIKQEYNFANARNAASGTLKQHDPTEVAKRKLTFIAYGIQSEDPLWATSCDECYHLLAEMNFLTMPYNTQPELLSSAIQIIYRLEQQRKDLPFEIDGAVLKVNNILSWDTLGNTNTAPRHSIAYKFKAERVTTILEGVDWQVGRLGAITPVALLKPVFVAGSTISKATLHNVAELKRLNLCYGDSVALEKAGDVIPKIIEVENTGTNKRILVPSICPSCSAPVEYTPTGLAIFCPNTEHCPAQIIGRLEHWCSKHAMDIQGVSTAILNTLYSAKKAQHFSDLYFLSYEDMYDLPGFGETLIANILEAIQNSKDKPWNNVLYALGIPAVGRRVANNIASAYSLEEVYRGQLGSDVTYLIKQNINQFFARSYGQDAYNAIKEHELNAYTQKAKVENNVLQGQTFLFTGTLSMKREDAEKRVVLIGGKIASAVSKNLSYLVAGDKAGSKLQKATKLEVPVLTETQFLELLNTCVQSTFI
jgi:DNA ligase (NAD+)